ncbi:MAG: transglutaminase domain-containing protein [Chlorobia bacterium]|nr:transglutaminase domain-containing protein [Fimbriimonadaceae bacterium]
MRSSALIFGLAMATSAFAGNFTIDSAFASDQAGNASQPLPGQAFWMTVRYQVGNTQNASMQVSSPWLNLTSPNFQNQAGQGQATYGPIVPLYDGAIPVHVRIGDDSVLVEVKLARPTRAIDYFEPRAWQADFGASLIFKSGQSAKVEWLVPKALSSGFQDVMSTRAFEGQLIASDIFRVQNRLETSAAFHATTSSVRVNAEILRTVGFPSLKKIPSDIKQYLKSETLIESNDKNVKNLVSWALPKKFDKSMSIYDAAQNLFRATVARIQYVDVAGGRPSAAQALRTGIGDCGFFAAAFSAACRNVGIPARPVTGFLAGTDAWHVWAEFYIPGHGWVPVDPSFADGLDPNGNLPLYFGVIPELNQRVATGVGFDHSVGKYKVPILQSPYALTDAKKVASAGAWCSLVEISR